jgi:hypothetical protein
VSTDDDALAAFKETRAVLSWVLTQLVTFKPPFEQLGDYVGPSKFLGIQRRARMMKVGEVWHLGVFLMGTDGTLFRAGDTVRAEDALHTEHNSAYKAERRELAHAAFRAGYKPGTVVNFGVSRINLDVDSLNTPTGPLFVRGRNAFVRWRSGAADDEAVPFKDYMAERLELLLNPPAGATD